MKKLIDLEGLKVFLGECKKNFCITSYYGVYVCQEV